MLTKLLVWLYLRIENRLIKKLDRLENGEIECICDNPEYIAFVEYDDCVGSGGTYVAERCINCGGTAIDRP